MLSNILVSNGTDGMLNGRAMKNKLSNPLLNSHREYTTKNNTNRIECTNSQWSVYDFQQNAENHLIQKISDQMNISIMNKLIGPQTPYLIIWLFDIVFHHCKQVLFFIKVSRKKSKLKLFKIFVVDFSQFKCFLRSTFFLSSERIKRL